MEHMEPFLKRWWFVDVFLLFQSRGYCQVPFFGFSGALFPRELGMADEDVDIWPPPQELKSTLNARPKVRKFWLPKHG